MIWLADLASTWWAWMAPMSVQVAGLALGVALVERLLGRRAWPQLRAVLWLAVLVKLVVPPTLSSPVSLTRALLTGEPVPAPPPASADGTLPQVLFAVWLLGVLGCGLGLARRWRQTTRSLRAARPAPVAAVAIARRAAARLGLRRLPELRLSVASASPAVAGIRRPVVLVGADLLEPGAERDLENALLHELAHLRRRDPLRSLLVLLVRLAYWFHPAVWFLGWRLDTLREIGCDAAVARVLGPEAASYRRTLLGLARRLIEPAPGPRLAFVRRGSGILARLDSLDRPAPRWPRLRALATTVLFGVLLACCVPLAQPPAEPSPLRFSDLQGCLQKRYYVLGLLAREQRQP